MTDQEIVKAVAELDGWLWVSTNEETFEHWLKGSTWCNTAALPDYLTSRDAIIPVIGKHINNPNNFNAASKFVHSVLNGWSVSVDMNFIRLLCLPPAQLCEALLRATGKWIE